MRYKIQSTRFLSSKLVDAWKRMEQQENVPSFLYYDYMKFVVRQTRYLQLWKPIFYYAVDEHDCIVMIAPMKKHLFSGEIDSLGNITMCDITDFLYDECILEDEKKTILSLLCDFIGKPFTLSRFLKDSKTLSALEGKVKLYSTWDCVNIKFGSSFDDYFKGLRPNVRQNVRTAYNRIERDGLKMEFSFYVNPQNVPKQIKRELEHCYLKRQMETYASSWLNSIRRYIVIRFLRHDHFSLNSNENAVLGALYLNGNVAGMFGGILDKKSMTVSIPRLAIDYNYKFYSPGYVMIIETIKYCIDNNTVRNLDLCRGTEKYKTDLGGAIYSSAFVRINE